MNSPYIDSLVEQIQNNKTKEYFKEVLSSYYSGNYRSAIVMLYTCLICDLVYKLQEMSEYYNDKVSEEILKTINKKQSENPRSSEWEKYLVTEMYNNHRIIEIPEYTNIEALQQHRNLCAHPILKDGADLYSPNGSVVQAHIINMLEGVFCKSSMISGKLFERFVEDLAKVKDIFIEDEFSKYITSKYLNKVNSIEIEFLFFKKLWKFVFKITNDECENNRKINYKALIIILSRHKIEFIKRIEQDKDYFGQYINLENPTGLEHLIYLMNEYPKIFHSLPEENKVSIIAYIDKDTHLKQCSLFNISDIKEYIFNIGFAFDSTITYLYRYLLNSYGQDTALDFYINQFSKSDSYDSADYRFEKYIRPYVNKFSEKQLKDIIVAIDSNGQIYPRKQSKYTTKIIVDKMMEMNPNFDFTKYKNVNYVLSKK